MSCERHPNSGTVWVGEGEMCYDCYWENFLGCKGKGGEAKEGELLNFYDWYQKKPSQEGQMERFWECYVEGTGGGYHYRHWTLEGAQKEAERLANLPYVRGKTVYLFECVAMCIIEPSPVRWRVL